MVAENILTILKITKISTLDAWTVIFSVTFLILSFVYFLGSGKNRKRPPGPTGLPVFGYYPFLGKDTVKSINELGKKYGGIFGFYIGLQYIVILNDWDSSTEALDKILDRPPDFAKGAPYDLGVSAINGPKWVEARRMMSKAMKDIGLHRTRWEQLVQEEADTIIGGLLKYGGKPVDVRKFFSETFATNMLTLILGQKVPPGSDTSRALITCSEKIIEELPTMGLINFSPLLYLILQPLGFEKKIDLAKAIEQFANIVSDMVDQKLKDSLSENEDSFIDQLHSEIKLRSNHVKMDEKFKEYTIKGNTIAVLSGGSDTSRTAFLWLLIAMAEHPEVQRKVHEELDSVIGREGTASWAIRKSIPYTHATILESMRWKTLVPHNTLRMTATDLEIQEYFIPKGTSISVNISALHNDPRYWTDPEKFMPERFLSEDGTKVNTSPPSYMPFSYGKRNCPGKLLGYISILAYFSMMMQKFRVIPKEGTKVKYDTSFGLTYQAYNAQLCFIPRH